MYFLWSFKCLQQSYLKLDRFGDGDAVLGDLGAAPGGLDDHISALDRKEWNYIIRVSYILLSYYALYEEFLMILKVVF